MTLRNVALFVLTVFVVIPLPFAAGYGVHQIVMGRMLAAFGSHQLLMVSENR